MTTPSGGDPPAEETASPPAKLGEERLAAPVVRTGMFGAHGTPDTSGYGGLQVHRPQPIASEPPYRGSFDAGAPAPPPPPGTAACRGPGRSRSPPSRPTAATSTRWPSRSAPRSRPTAAASA